MPRYVVTRIWIVDAEDSVSALEASGFQGDLQHEEVELLEPPFVQQPGLMSEEAEELDVSP